MNRLYLLVAYPVLATQLFGLFHFILHLIFWKESNRESLKLIIAFRPETPDML